MDKKLKSFINKKIDEKVNQKLKKNLWIKIFLIIFTIVLTSFSTVLIQEHFREKYADIKVAYIVNENNVTFTLHNDAKVSASEIKFIGNINGEEKVIKVIRDKILSKEKDIKIDIPFEKINKTSEIKRIPKQDNTFQGWVLPTDRDFQDSDLLYKIECDTCNNRDMGWKIVRIPAINYYFTIRNIGGELFFNAVYQKPQWIVT